MKYSLYLTIGLVCRTLTGYSMKAGLPRYLIILILLCFHDVLANTEIEDDIWIRRVETPDQSLNLNCSDFPSNPTNDSGPILDGATIIGWILPDFTIAPVNWSHNNRHVRSNGEEFYFDSVSNADIGVYHCMWELSNGDQYLVKWGVNIRGPYFISLWDKYEQNTIIAFSAFGGFLVVAILVMLTYYFQYEPKHVPEYDVTQAYSNGGNVNKAYDEVETFPPPPPAKLLHVELKDMPSWGSDATHTKMPEPEPDYSPGPYNRKFETNKPVQNGQYDAKKPDKKSLEKRQSFKDHYDEEVTIMWFREQCWCLRAV